MFHPPAPAEKDLNMLARSARTVLLPRRSVFRQQKLRPPGLALVAISAVCVLPHATADTMLGDFTGMNVAFTNVSTPGITFGSPNLLTTSDGELLDFSTDNNFAVESKNGGPGDDFPMSRSDTVTSTVEGLDGFTLTELTATVRGGVNFFPIGGTTPTTATRVTADVGFEVLVLAVGGVDLMTPLPLSGSGTAFEVNAVDDAGVRSEEGSYFFDLQAEAAGAGLAAPITRIDWTVTVTFAAESERLTGSRLDFVGYQQLVLAVPEPASGAALTVLVGLVASRRRRPVAAA